MGPWVKSQSGKREAARLARKSRVVAVLKFCSMHESLTIPAKARHWSLVIQGIPYGRSVVLGKRSRRYNHWFVPC